MRDTIKILGVPIDNITLEEAGNITKDLILDSNKTCKMIFAPNVEFIMKAQKDEYFFNILQQSELATPDSVGIMYGAKVQKKNFKERIPRTSIF